MLRPCCQENNSYPTNSLYVTTKFLIIKLRNRLRSETHEQFNVSSLVSPIPALDTISKYNKCFCK